jgi:ABC-2 type transport system permease protein
VTEQAALGTRRRGGTLRVVAGLFARDIHVARLDLIGFVLRTIANPLFFVFVFGYVLPKIGQRISGGGTDESFGTILLPGLIGISMMFQGITGVAVPLTIELGRTKEIVDRVMAPAPIAWVAIEKVLMSATQSLIAAGLVFPLAYFIRATPVHVHVADWPLLIAVLVLGALTGGALGLFLGTIVKPTQIQALFSVLLTPFTFLGCVYYPWQALAGISWLKVIVLVNPLVYLNEGLRGALTPQVAHLGAWAFLGMLTLLFLAFMALGIRNFTRRVTA